MKSPQVSYTGAETPNVQPDGLSQRSPSRMLKSNEYLSEGEMEDRAKDMADMDTSAAIKESHLDSGKPRPEVTLRTKRFIALVLLSVGFIGFITALFLWGINVDSVNEAVGSSTKSENTVDKYNTYSGIVMGVFETILGLGFGNFFPVFTTYVYNLKWFPGDDPSVRVSKVKKVGVMLFFPLLMVAFGNTFTALQAGSSTNGADLLLTPSDLNATAANSNSATNTTNELIDFADSVEELHSPLVQLEDTILRTVVDRRVTPFEYSSNSVCTNKITASGISYLKRLSAVDSTSLIAGFPINEWAKEMYPETPLVVSDDKLDLDTSFKLAFHGQAMMEYTYSAVKSRKPCTTDDTDTSDGYANADCYDSTATNTVLPNMLGYVNGTYEQSYDALDTAIADGIEFVFSSSDGSIQAMNRSTLSVEHQSFSLSSSMKLDALSISMEFNIDQYGNYEGVSWEDCSGDYCEYGYDFYSNGGFCGSTSCVFFDYENTYRAIPRLQALMTRYMKSCSDTIEYSPDVGNDVPIDCNFESNSAFIYGHGARMIGESVVNTNSSGEVYPYAINLRHQVYFTFGRITWESQDLSATFEAQCESVTGCHGYYHNLSSSGRYVMLAEFNLPEAVSSADFIHPIKLYELVSPVIQQQANLTAIPFRLEKDNFNEYSISLKGDNCSSIAESFINQIEVNHYWENDPMQATYTSALLYLFQRGAVTSVFQEDIGTSFGKMALSQDLMLSTIYVSNTTVGAVTLWVGCGIILLLAIAALVMPNERARLGPPRGSNIRAERFIGVQTEELYPNLVYKKRFLVGEEIKFREFAVESVTLHHKMEEEAHVRL